MEKKDLVGVLIFIFAIGAGFGYYIGQIFFGL